MYSAQITRANPTCIVLLLDQSGSMADPFGGAQAYRKADFVAKVVNHALHDLVIRCTKTEEVRNYYYVSIIGYGRTVGPAFAGALADRAGAPVSEIADYPVRIETGHKRVPDGMGGFVEMPVRYPVWLYPQADGGTPMCEAFARVRSIIGQWLAEHPRGFPPTVLHLTDGESGDGDPTDIFLLLSDAVAAWYFESFEQERLRSAEFESLLAASQDAGLVGLIRRERSANRMKDDDVAAVRVAVGRRPPGKASRL
ncbi:MAG: hypothetical protein ACRD68_02385 [Pyrinomonadaceae bacterium]